jgi:hypothetical protein
MSDWKDLEIGDIPRDFFVNDRYEVEHFETDPKKFGCNEWGECGFSSLGRVNFVKFLIDGTKYRYRLKPLETARITKEMARDLRARVVNGNYDSLEDLYGRPVEIIMEE